MFGPIMRFSVHELEIELAPLKREDMATFVTDGAMQNREVTQFLDRRSAPVLEDEYEWFDRSRGDRSTLVWGIYLIEARERRLIGNTGLHNLGEGVMRYSITGCMIFRPEFWGKGIVGAAHKARTWFAFTQMQRPLVQLRSAVLEPNVASQRALEGVGYVPVFFERNEAFIDGRFVGKTSLDCINPLEPFWSSWWHGDRVPARYTQAKSRTLAALEWAETNVRFG